MVVLGMRVVWVMSIVDWSIWVHWWTGFRLNFRPPAVSHVNFIQIRERERERERDSLENLCGPLQIQRTGFNSFI